MRYVVALVDESPQSRLELRAALDGGYEVIDYPDAIAALRGFSIVRPDLILLNVSLPGLDGAKLVEYVRQDPRLAGVRIIAMTAGEVVGDRARLLAAGFDDHMTKSGGGGAAASAAIARALAPRSAVAGVP